jgi:uncharacterized protein
LDKSERREGAGRIRRCALSHETLPEAELIRFVAAPDGSVFPDPVAKAPGRGVWVRASRAAVDQAVKKNVFARSLKGPARPGAELADITDALLFQRCLGLLSMAKRAGIVVTGFDQVEAALRRARPAWRIEASDGSSDGRGKLNGLTLAWEEDGNEVPTAGCFTSAEIGMALGRDYVIHALLTPGRMADSWTSELNRLAGFRPLTPENWTPKNWTPHSLKEQTGGHADP